MREGFQETMFLKDNPERLMIFMFPLITLALFVVAAVLWWLITSDPLNIL